MRPKYKIVTQVVQMAERTTSLVTYTADHTGLPTRSTPATATPKTLNDWRARSPWFGLVPQAVAEQQIEWERREAITRMRNLGYPIAEIAKRWCVSPGTAAYLLHLQADKRRRASLAPVTKFLADDAALLALARLVRRTAINDSIKEGAWQTRARSPRLPRLID